MDYSEGGYPGVDAALTRQGQWPSILDLISLCSDCTTCPFIPLEIGREVELQCVTRAASILPTLR